MPDIGDEGGEKKEKKGEKDLPGRTFDMICAVFHIIVDTLSEDKVSHIHLYLYLAMSPLLKRAILM